MLKQVQHDIVFKNLLQSTKVVQYIKSILMMQKRMIENKIAGYLFDSAKSNHRTHIRNSGLSGIDSRSAFRRLADGNDDIGGLLRKTGLSA